MKSPSLQLHLTVNIWRVRGNWLVKLDLEIVQSRYFIYTVASSNIRHKDFTYLWVLNNQTLIIHICKTKHRDPHKKGHCFRESDYTVWSLWDPTPSKRQQFCSASHICWLWFAKHLSREERCTCRRSVGGLIHKLQVRWAMCKESALHTVLIISAKCTARKKESKTLWTPCFMTTDQSDFEKYLLHIH